MTLQNGFFPLRRGLFEHVRNGRLNQTAALILIYMLGQADTRTGVWIGSAGAISGELGFSKSTAKYALERLDGVYIRRFPVPGRHICYPILLHKYLVRDGQHVGRMLDALSSTNPTALVYVSQNADQHVIQLPDQHIYQPVGTQRRIENREKRIKKEEIAAKSTPPADGRFKAFYECAYEAYRAKNGQPPTWSGRDRKNLKLFLADQAQVTLGEWQRRFLNYQNSTEHFIRTRGGSLAYFVANFDAFASGPVLAKTAVGGLYANQHSRTAAIVGEPGKYDGLAVHRASNGTRMPELPGHGLSSER